LFLRDVVYRIHAYFELLPDAGQNNSIGKFLDMFERRAEKGQCINQPYLGCREFVCDFRLVNMDTKQIDREKLSTFEKMDLGFENQRDLGWMLYDMDYCDTADPKPKFFRAKLENGVLHVPSWNSEEVRG